MEPTEYESLVEQSAVIGMKKNLIPYLEGKTPSKNIDKQKMTISMQAVTTFSRILQSREHRRGLNLVAIKMMTHDDREAAKKMITKHFDKAMALPEPK